MRWWLRHTNGLFCLDNPGSHFVCTLVLQAAHREEYAREGTESQLREEKTGKTQEVSANESTIIENQVHILIVFVGTWSETILCNKLHVLSFYQLHYLVC